MNYNCFEYQRITLSAPETGREVKGRINMLKEKEVAMNVYVLGLFFLFCIFFFSQENTAWSDEWFLDLAVQSLQLLKGQLFASGSE